MSSRLYCTLDDVKRLIRAGERKESRIRFSDSFKDLKRSSKNNGNIILTGVAFKDNFSQHETFTFEFTDSTSFEVSGNIVGYVGAGNRFEEYDSTNRFSVPIVNWSGAAQTGDKIYITANSDISNDDGEAFIEDASVVINTELLKDYGDLVSIPFYYSSNENIPDTVEDVPDIISYICARFAAYEIFIFLHPELLLESGESIVAIWKKLADDALSDFRFGHGKGPIWRSRESLVTEVGVKGVKEGVINIDELTGDSNRDYTR